MTWRGGLLHKTIALAAVSAALISILTVTKPPRPAYAQQAGFSVSDGRLFDANGYEVVLRGVNHPHAWFSNQMRSIGDIKAAGANAVRVVLSSGDRFERTDRTQLEAIVGRCKQHRLVCVLELHDTTGYLEVERAISLQAAADYWVEMAPALIGEEAFVIVNIGNEPFANISVDEWADSTTAAVARLREAGFRHTLMVDAPNWGQDWSKTMHEHAASVLAADPDENLIFSVHMYGVYDTESKVRSYYEDFVRAELALVVGEFGADHTDGNPHEDAIMAWAEAYGIGYLAWSWSGNVEPVQTLNVVEDFDPSTLSTWGERLINGANGLRATSIEASVFGTTVRQGRLAQRMPLPLAARETRTTQRVVDRAEAEDGLLNGLRVSVKGAGFSGEGYVDDFSALGDSLSMVVHADEPGEYDLRIGYRAQHGEKIQQIYVNGLPIARVRFAASDDFTSVVLPSVVLTSGPSVVMIASDWGWIDLDYLEVLQAARTG